MLINAAADFDRLAPRLRGGKRVTIDLAQPYGAHDGPPAGLTPWLDAVKTSGGSVTVSQYCRSSRDLGSWLNRLFGGTPATPATRPYRSARNYDVVLHTDALDEMVTQIEFLPRAGRAL